MEGLDPYKISLSLGLSKAVPGKGLRGEVVVNKERASRCE